MYIVINCLGLPFDGNTVKESSLGGSETAAYYMAKELVMQGHNVKLFTAGGEQGSYDGVDYIHAGPVSNQFPMGEQFHFYAENTPHDVLIIQRSPGAFIRKFASKINLWWVHDLALKRQQKDISGHLWNVDGILCVSEFHKQQWIDVYGINPDIIFPITNGIDLSLYEDNNGHEVRCHEIFRPLGNQKKLIYSSRPERGLEHLVMPGGIMGKLWEKDKDFHLYVCGYNNVTERTAEFYAYLHHRCEQLPNVTNLGSLTKQELADVQRQVDLHVYPLPGLTQPMFDEVSCITAMECMAAGLPMMVSDRGAIPETCKGSGTILKKPNDDGFPSVNSWVKGIIKQFKIKGENSLNVRSGLQKLAAPKFSWDKPAKILTAVIIPQLINKNRTEASIAKELMRNSDIYCLKQFLETPKKNKPNLILNYVASELSECYEFAFTDNFKEHYAAYYQYEKDRGVNYGPENLTGNGRFEYISSLIAKLNKGSVVLDYGCAHGHYTVNLAKRFPELDFIGIDIEGSNIDKAANWAIDESLENIHFYNGFVKDGAIKILCDDASIQQVQQVAIAGMQVDFLIAAEVVEHVADPAPFIDALCTYLKSSGTICITTPYGPWEAQGYTQHWPFRAHLYHFDKQDVTDMFGHHPEFTVKVLPVGQSRWGIHLGSLVYTFKKPLMNIVSKLPNYEDKLSIVVPSVQTVSLCMIVRDASETLLRCLNSAKDIVDEIIICIDEHSDDLTRSVIADFENTNPHLLVTVKDIPSPQEIGFDEARNLSIADASGDWILWLDSDEFIVHPENIYKYLRNNQFNGYAVQQHHVSMEPVGVIKTDLPVRLFRNNIGIKFFGVVHEHPEIKMNDGVGHAQAIYDFKIAHQGYVDENVRRGRFHRNIDLLARDRTKYPERYLGKFLWMRDLAQMSQYEMEVNGGHITQDMKDRAEEGIKLWEELLEDDQLRMLVDGMDFYSTLCQILGDTFEFGFTLDASKLNGGINLDSAQRVTGLFRSKDHVLKLFNALTNEKVKDYEQKYF